MADNDMIPEARKQRRRRNAAIAIGLAAFVLIVYLVTILKITGNIGGAS